jgi:hypothetical protein
LIAGFLALILVGGVGAYAAQRLWFGGGSQPESVLPADTMAFAKVDLSPGLGQLVKIYDLSRKFPQQPDIKGANADETFDSAMSKLLTEAGLTGVSYEQDVKPWLGRRAGVGIWKDGAQKTHALMSIQVTDEGKATTSLHKILTAGSLHNATVGSAVGSGYALISSALEAGGSRQAEDQAAQAALQAAGKQSLADAPAYKAAAATISSDLLASGYVDLDAIRSTPKVTDMMMAGKPGASSELDATLHGQIVFGLHATDNAIETQLRWHNAPAVKHASNIRPDVEKLPAGTAYALGLSGAVLGPVWNPVRSSLKALFTSPSGQSAVSDATLDGLLDSTVTAGCTGFASPNCKIQFTAGSEQAANEIARLFSGAQGLKLSRSGKTLTVTVGSGTAAGAGLLASSARYKAAIPQTSWTVTGLLYVDIQAAASEQKLSAKDAANIKPLSAFGLVTGLDGADAVFNARVVIQ